MTFIELLTNLHRILDDPKVHPSTPVKVEIDFDPESDDYVERRELVSITPDGGVVVLSALDNNAALAR